MKTKTLVNGLADIINDHIEGDLEPDTEAMFLTYLKESDELKSFVKESGEGKLLLKKAYRVKASDDFEKKLANKIVSSEGNYSF